MNTEQQAFRVAYLVAGFLKGELTSQENTELDDWVTASLDNQRLFEDLTDPTQLNALHDWKKGLPTEQVLQRLKARTRFTEPATILPAKTRSMWPALTAAAAVVIIAVGFYWLTRPAQEFESPLPPTPSTAHADLPPGSKKAILVQASGERIFLDSLTEGQQIPMEGSGHDQLRAHVIHGAVEYPLLHRDQSYPPLYNTLITPRGATCTLVLPDGTKAWLNAGSSLKYELVMTDRDRIVELTGEAYFEVAKDPGHPFIVKTDHSTVQVYGTHFNVNAYADLPNTRVTLLEGAVTVNERKLLPGQQAIIDVSKGLAILTVDTDPVIAWTKGQFSFKDATLGEILPQLSRWYDADIEYPNNITYHFNADIPRSVPVSKILTLLEGTGVVKFSVEHQKIIVRPVASK